MPDRRPIDVQRESGMRMDVGTPDDDSAITEMCEIDGSLHVIKSRGIYQIKLADEIDPQRVNPTVPNTQQRVLGYGSDNEIVARTLLTAKGLFNPNYLGASFDSKRALTLAFEALKDLVAMHELRLQFEAAEEQAKKNLDDRRRMDGSVMVPSIGNVVARCETFIQKADHAIASLFEIAKLFYGDTIGPKWFESLTKLVEERYGADAPFARFMKDALRFLKFIRNTRNCVEHPKAAQRVRVCDFALSPNAQVMLPTIEVVHPETPNGPIVVTAFMSQMTDQIVGIFELMIAFLCAYNIQPIGGFPIQVVQLPPDQRSNKNVRFSYGVCDGKRVMPAS